MAIRIVVVGMGPCGQDWLREIEKASESSGLAVMVEKPFALNLREAIALVGLAGAPLKEPDSSGRDNLQTMAVVEGCVRSASEQRELQVVEPLLKDLYRAVDAHGR